MADFGQRRSSCPTPGGAKILVPFASGISFLLFAFMLHPLCMLAQDPPGPCKPGKLVPDYEKTQCTVGSLLFDFGEQKSTMAKTTSVKPTKNGLEFSLSASFDPNVAPADDAEFEPDAIAAYVGVDYSVTAMSGTITQAVLTGNIGGLKPPAVISINMRVNALKPDSVRMELHDCSSLVNTFSTPVKAGVKVPIFDEVEGHTGKGAGKDPIIFATDPVTITFTNTFTPGG